MRKLSLLLILLVVVLSLIGCSSQPLKEAVTPSVDTMTSASIDSYHYEESTIKGQELMDAINQSLGTTSIATTNADGTPNIATMIPAMFEIDGTQYLVFGHGENQTVKNLRERKYGMIEFYIYKPELKGDENKFKRNIGARLVVEYVPESNDAIDEITTNIYKASYSDSIESWMTVLKVIEVKPLG